MKLDVRGPLRVGDLLEYPENQPGGAEVRLIACPACYDLFYRRAGERVSDHIRTHEAADFGLSPHPGPDVRDAQMLAADGSGTVLVTPITAGHSTEVYHLPNEEGGALCNRAPNAIRKPWALVEQRGLERCGHCDRRIGDVDVDTGEAGGEA